MNTKHPIIPHLVLIVAIISWGGMWIFVKELTNTVHPLNVVLGRFLIAAIFFVPFVIPKLKQFRKKDIIPVMAAVLLATAVANMFSFWGAKLSTASETSIIVNTNPLFIILLAPLLIKEQATRIMRLGIVVGLLGLFLVVFQGVDVSAITAKENVGGNLLTLASALSIALGTIFQKKYIHQYGAAAVTGLTFLGATLLMLVVNSTTGLLTQFPLSGPELTNLIYLGTLTTIIPFLGFNYGIKHIGVNKAGSYKILIPIATAILAVLFLRENLSLYTIGGMAATIGGLILIQFSKTTLNTRKI